MTKDEIIAKTLRELKLMPLESQPPSSDEQALIDYVTAELMEKLPDGIDIRTCDDFKHLGAQCCETCHELPDTEMYVIDLPDGGKAWVCDQVQWAIYPEKYWEFQKYSCTQEQLMKVMDYYPTDFSRDLDLVFGTQRPRYFGGSWSTGGCPELMNLAAEIRPLFLAYLHYTVLLDQGLYHHAHHEYKNTALCAQKPKFCQGAGKSHMNPRGIIRYPIRRGLVSADDLMRVAAPAANMILAVFVDTVAELLPEVSLPNFFHLLVHFPEVDWWAPREARRYPAETAVEQRFLDELVGAIKDFGF